MSRQTKPSTTDHLLDRSALLPAWAGILLTIGAYVLLHSVATQALDAAASPGNGVDSESRALWLSVAGIAQYALPIVLLVLTALSVWRRQRPGDPKAQPAQGKSKHPLDDLTFEQFEAQLAVAFQGQGYQIIENQRSGAGGRVEMVLRRDRETFLVLCKQWKDHRVAVDVVQQLQRIMTARGAIGGMVVTSGRFSREAAAFAGGCNIRLIDGAILAGMLKTQQPTRVRAGVGAT